MVYHSISTSLQSGCTGFALMHSLPSAMDVQFCGVLAGCQLYCTCTTAVPFVTNPLFLRHCITADLSLYSLCITWPVTVQQSSASALCQYSSH